MPACLLHTLWSQVSDFTTQMFLQNGHKRWEHERRESSFTFDQMLPAFIGAGMYWVLFRSLSFLKTEQNRTPFPQPSKHTQKKPTFIFSSNLVPKEPVCLPACLSRSLSPSLLIFHLSLVPSKCLGSLLSLVEMSVLFFQYTIFCSVKLRSCIFPGFMLWFCFQLGCHAHVKRSQTSWIFLSFSLQAVHFFSYVISHLIFVLSSNLAPAPLSLFPVKC